MGPFIYAIFLLCSSDHMVCIDANNLQMQFENGNLKACQYYVEDVLEFVNNDPNYVYQGKCVWRIIDVKEFTFISTAHL